MKAELTRRKLANILQGNQSSFKILQHNNFSLESRLGPLHWYSVYSIALSLFIEFIELLKGVMRCFDV